MTAKVRERERERARFQLPYNDIGGNGIAHAGLTTTTLSHRGQSFREGERPNRGNRGAKFCAMIRQALSPETTRTAAGKLG